MNLNKIIGIVVFILGVIALGGGLYVQNEVKKGRTQISYAEKTTNKLKKFLSSKNAKVKKFGGQATGYVAMQVSESKEKAAFYEKVYYALFAIGIILLVLGGYIIYKKPAN